MSHDKRGLNPGISIAVPLNTMFIKKDGKEEGDVLRKNSAGSTIMFGELGRKPSP
jgi:hypothetical protein